MRLSVIQMNANADKGANISRADRIIRAALDSAHPDMVAMPEMWSCLGGSLKEKQSEAEVLPPVGNSTSGGKAYEFLRSMAIQNRIYVHGGSIAEILNERLFNTTVVFNSHGIEVARYRKIHLFDISTPDGVDYRESSIFNRGADLVTYKAHGFRIGCAICYDIRFPELFLSLRRAGADLIILPSAFTISTGRDHWEVLLRARAIDSQCWFAAPATWGQHTQGEISQLRTTFGHSLVSDPWGRIVNNLHDGDGFVTAEISSGLIQKVRGDMPLSEHRRLI